MPGEERVPPQHIVGDEAVAAYDQQQARAIELLRQDGVPFIVVALNDEGKMEFLAALPIDSDGCVIYLEDAKHGIDRMIDFYKEGT